MAGELLERCISKATTGCSDGPARAADVATASGDDDKDLAEEQDLQVPVLPHDVIADVFSRLAPRWVAASRCVCRDWRAAIDARRLLRTDLLPLSPRGIFVHFYYHRFPEFFAHPSSTSTGVGAITGSLDFLPNTDTSIKSTDPGIKDYDIQDHCNGLLLLNKYVVNPATRRWDPLPPCPPYHDHHVLVHTDESYDYINISFNKYLAFDPTVSPHYEVFVVPHMCSTFHVHGDAIDPMVDESRLLSSSSTCTLRVFSSRYGSWEWRSFVREGSAAEAVCKLQLFGLRERAVYWRGALYVQRNANFVVRISPSNNSYRVISPPVGMSQSIHPTRHLERSEHGVYFAALDNYRLKVWILNESYGQTEWILKLDKDIEPVLAPHSCDQQVYKPKIEEGFNSGENKKGIVKGRFQSRSYKPEVRILGFHPYKEVIFMSEVVDKRKERITFGPLVEKGLAYHLSTSKVEDLGNICPKNYLNFQYYRSQGIKYSFIYTPCWLGEFPRNS